MTDITLEIAVANSRTARTWKNTSMLWSDLLTKLSATHRTVESFADYLRASAQRQSEIKDVGGFVGAHLAGGRRKNTSVVRRQLLTLDADTADPDFWDNLTLQLPNAAAMYSTHKHCPEKPRLRLLIPLDRPVLSDEYQPLARRVAEILGIDQFDPSGFRPAQLMYWPSTSKDGEYLFNSQDGPLLAVDELLATYTDWRNTAEWPLTSAEKDLPARSAKKQGDPTEKPGLIGAFCRTYTIQEALETFLSDVYEPTDQADRYTYLHGSTAGGLVLYDDKFAYSHHGTDPTGGQLCNAFDLVRIHKFGLKDEDEDAEHGTPTSKLPSYIAMNELAAADDNVKKTFAAEKLDAAQYDFAEDFEPEEVADDDPLWITNLEVNQKGDYLSTINNVYLILKHDAALKGRIVLNEFDGRMLVTKDLPWRKVTPGSRDFTDDDADCLAHYLESKKMPFTHISKALSKIRTDNKIHPVREYLQRLKWDGVERVDRLFIDYLGAEDSKYTRAVARKTLVAAVARVFRPGIKFDTVLTLVGPEGIGKSTLIAELARDWFSDCLGDIHSKEGMETLRGVWIMEIAELSAFRKADQEAIKRFISSREDVFRPSYGKYPVRLPRQCIFFASTNTFDFLSAGHRNRRFWPVNTGVNEPVKRIFDDEDTGAKKDLTDVEVNQIWAEAVHLFKAGESLVLGEEVRQMAEAVREKHTHQDDRAGLIDKYLNLLLPDNWADLGIPERRNYLSGVDEIINPETTGTVKRDCVCAAEIWCELFGGHLKEMNSVNTKFIHDVLRSKKGWKYDGTKRFVLYGKQKIYRLETKRLSGNAAGNAVFGLSLISSELSGNAAGNATDTSVTSEAKSGNAGNATGNAK